MARRVEMLTAIVAYRQVSASPFKVNFKKIKNKKNKF